jgi:hypothetical protein
MWFFSSPFFFLPRLFCSISFNRVFGRFVRGVQKQKRDKKTWKIFRSRQKKELLTYVTLFFPRRPLTTDHRPQTNSKGTGPREINAVAIQTTFNSPSISAVSAAAKIVRRWPWPKWLCGVVAPALPQRIFEVQLRVPWRGKKIHKKRRK